MVLEVEAEELKCPIEDQEGQQPQWLDKLADAHLEEEEHSSGRASHCSVHCAEAEDEP